MRSPGIHRNTFAFHLQRVIFTEVQKIQDNLNI